MVDKTETSEAEDEKNPFEGFVDYTTGGDRAPEIESGGDTAREEDADAAEEDVEEAEDDEDVEEEDTEELDDEDEDVEDAEDTDDEEEEAEEKPKKKKKGTPAKQRIRELTAKRREAERRAEEAERRLREIEQQRETGAEEPDKKADLTKGEEGDKDDDEAPNPEDYEYGELDSKYILDLSRYGARQESRKVREEMEQQRQAEAAAARQQELRQKWDSHVENGVEKYDDFEELVIEGAENGDWPLSQTMGELIISSDVGADIAYHLATHPQEAEKLDGMQPVEQAVAFGRLEARFSSSEDAPKKKSKATKAPKPVEQPRGRGGKFKPSPSTNDFRAFERMANEER